MPQSPYFIYLPDVESWLDDVFKAKSSEVLVPSSVSHVQLFVNARALAYQAPLSMEFSRQKYWSGLPFPSSKGSSQPRDLTRVSCIADRFFKIWAIKILQIFRTIHMKLHYWWFSCKSLKSYFVPFDITFRITNFTFEVFFLFKDQNYINGQMTYFLHSCYWWKTSFLEHFK